MFSLLEGTTAVQFARQVIEDYVTSHTTPAAHLSNSFQDKQGVFVTLHTHPDRDLRGCIGLPYPVMPLEAALIQAAQSATQDPRFPPLTTQELSSVVVEVTLLSKPERIKVTQPQQYLSHIKIGHDGLIVEQGYRSGLLLPQVPVEQGWSTEEFLTHTCMKAGLLPDAWFDAHTKISKFTGQIFTETQPHGPIKETHLHGPKH
ncbi:MAG: TIGR00296 family protein [Candidatus Thermoplasmatota archaeon]|nr:TIGR00296 family protein [Candidatus Thermoplasmatota archaeon]